MRSNHHFDHDLRQRHFVALGAHFAPKRKTTGLVQPHFAECGIMILRTRRL